MKPEDLNASIQIINELADLNTMADIQAALHLPLTPEATQGLFLLCLSLSLALGASILRQWRKNRNTQPKR